MSNLRERRRAQTSKAICRAAVELAFEHGLDTVTTEMISEAAGISPRTFFNYFPYKEAALIPPPLVLPDEAIDEFVDGSGALLDDISILLAPTFENISDDQDVIRKSHEVALSNPKLMGLRASTFHEFDATIESLIRKRLGEQNETHHMAALISASIRVGFEAWIKQEEIPANVFISKNIKAIKHLFAHI